MQLVAVINVGTAPDGGGRGVERQDDPRRQTLAYMFYPRPQHLSAIAEPV
jgi:hypothetical protein